MYLQKPNLHEKCTADSETKGTQAPSRIQVPEHEPNLMLSMLRPFLRKCVTHRGSFVFFLSRFGCIHREEKVGTYARFGGVFLGVGTAHATSVRTTFSGLS